MVLRRPHKRMKMGRRVSFFHRLVALPLPPLWIPAFAGMTKSVAGVYPGSELRTCIHSNRSRWRRHTKV